MNRLFLYGDRFTQTTLAQLRLGHSQLRAHQARLDGSDPTCQCGLSQETAHHFLLECPLYDSQRFALFHTLGNLLPPHCNLSEGILLGSHEFKWRKPLYKAVARALGTFIRRTERL